MADGTGVVTRPVTYDTTKVWGWNGSAWGWIASGSTGYTNLLTTGGGRFHQTIVVVAYGTIYYGSMT
jgi:hypothetical protein